MLLVVLHCRIFTLKLSNVTILDHYAECHNDSQICGSTIKISYNWSVVVLTKRYQQESWVSSLDRRQSNGSILPSLARRSTCRSYFVVPPYDPPNRPLNRKQPFSCNSTFLRRSHRKIHFNVAFRLTCPDPAPSSSVECSLQPSPT